jgi:hypothetical protein
MANQRPFGPKMLSVRPLPQPSRSQERVASFPQKTRPRGPGSSLPERKCLDGKFSIWRRPEPEPKATNRSGSSSRRGDVAIEAWPGDGSDRGSEHTFGVEILQRTEAETCAGEMVIYQIFVMKTHPVQAVIASEAKQSRLLPPLVDDFVATLLAMMFLTMVTSLSTRFGITISPC